MSDRISGSTGGGRTARRPRGGVSRAVIAMAAIGGLTVAVGWSSRSSDTCPSPSMSRAAPNSRTGPIARVELDRLFRRTMPTQLASPGTAFTAPARQSPTVPSPASAVGRRATQVNKDGILDTLRTDPRVGVVPGAAPESRPPAVQWHKLDRALVQALRSDVASSEPVRVIVQGQPDVVANAPRSSGALDVIR